MSGFHSRLIVLRFPGNPIFGGSRSQKKPASWPCGKNESLEPVTPFSSSSSPWKPQRCSHVFRSTWYTYVRGGVLSLSRAPTFDSVRSLDLLSSSSSYETNVHAHTLARLQFRRLIINVFSRLFQVSQDTVYSTHGSLFVST